MRTAHRTCPICDAVCGLKLSLDDDGKVLAVAGDADDPFSRGNICPKGASFGLLDSDPDRLRTPMVKVDGEWREASWDEAFQRVDEGLRGVWDGHGRDAVAVYWGNPTFHTMAGFMYRQPLSQSLATRNVYSASTIDQMPKHVSGGLMFGDPMAIAVPDLDRTDYLLVIGANPVESNGSLCAAPDFAGRLKALRARGGRLVVVDPRRTRTAAMADEHLFVRPGTDAALLLGIVHTLLADGVGVDVDANGVSDLHAAVDGFAPEVVAPWCGVAAEDIGRLARELAAARTAAVYTRIGTCTAEFGTVTQWLVDVVNILTGNFDSPGGVMFTRTAALEIFRTGQAFSSGNWHSRVRGLPEVLGEFPVATLADEIEEPGDGQVRALISIAGNLVLSAPNGPRLGSAMQGLDFMVAVDPYLNETTQLADVILPPPRMTQSPHYDFLLLTVTVRNYARFSPPAVPLSPRQLSEAEILARLTLIAAGAGPSAGGTAAVDEQIIEQILGAATQIPGSSLFGQDPAELRSTLDGDSAPEVLLDAMLRAGPHGLSLSALRENPSGVDLGPLEPRFKELLCTASGRLELAPQPLLDDLGRLRSRMAAPVPEVLLIGRRQLRSNNSWLHNVPVLVGGSNTCTLHIHPDDISRLGLGSTARLTSPAGSLTVVVEANDGIMPGVVSLPHGWGHSGSPNRVAAAHPGVNANALTDATVLDPLSGNAVFNGVPVNVTPA